MSLEVLLDEVRRMLRSPPPRPPARAGHFRDAAQAHRALSILMRIAGAPHLWTRTGPSVPPPLDPGGLAERALDADRAMFPLRFAWAAYRGTLPDRSGVATVDHATAQALLSLWTAMLIGHDAVDRWIAAQERGP